MRVFVPLGPDAGADTESRHVKERIGTMKATIDTTKRDARGYPVNVRMNEGTARDASGVDARGYHHGRRNAGAMPPAPDVPRLSLNLPASVLAAPDTITPGDATRHGPLLAMIARRTVPASHRDDCIQEQRAALWARRGTSPASVGVVANGAAIDYARKYCRVSARGVERDAMPLQDVGAGDAGAVDPWPDVDARLDGTDTIKALIGAANLPTLDLQIMQWRYVAGDSYRAIGERLAMDAGAVRVRLHRTIKTLRDVAGVAA